MQNVVVKYSRLCLHIIGMKSCYIYLGHTVYKCYIYTKYLEHIQSLYNLYKIFTVAFFCNDIKERKKLR